MGWEVEGPSTTIGAVQKVYSAYLPLCYHFNINLNENVIF